MCSTGTFQWTTHSVVVLRAMPVSQAPPLLLSLTCSVKRRQKIVVSKGVYYDDNDVLYIDVHPLIKCCNLLVCKDTCIEDNVVLSAVTLTLSLSLSLSLSLEFYYGRFM